MRRCAFSPAAIADLDEIWTHTARTWGADQADRYIDGIQDACNRLASGDRQGRAVNIREGYLKYSVGRHFVFFRHRHAGIEVIRILYQRMDVGQYL